MFHMMKMLNCSSLYMNTLKNPEDLCKENNVISTYTENVNKIMHIPIFIYICCNLIDKT